MHLESSFCKFWHLSHGNCSSSSSPNTCLKEWNPNLLGTGTNRFYFYSLFNPDSRLWPLIAPSEDMLMHCIMGNCKHVQKRTTHWCKSSILNAEFMLYVGKKKAAWSPTGMAGDINSNNWTDPEHNWPPSLLVVTAFWIFPTPEILILVWIQHAANEEW